MKTVFNLLGLVLLALSTTLIINTLITFLKLV